MKMKGTPEKITAHWPQPSTLTKIQTGFNWRYQGVTYSFHYNDRGIKANKIVSNKNVWEFLSGQETESILRILDLQKKPKKVKSPTPTKKRLTGTQACIDHIIRKKSLIDADTTRKNIQLSNMMGILIDELKQYL